MSMRWFLPGLMLLQAGSAGGMPQNQTCIFSGEFTQKKTVLGIPAPLESSGIFLHHCEQGIIWQTNSPIKDILVVSKAEQVFQIQDNKVKKLNARASHMIARVIKGLMSNDQRFLEENFVVEHGSQNGGQTIQILTPKKRRLKRAFKEITLLQNPSANTDVEITMRDKRDQTTEIIASKGHAEVDLGSASNCGSSSFDALACQTLYANKVVESK